MDPTAFHILIQLLKRGDLDHADVDEIAARLDEEGESDASRAVRAAPLEASGPSQAEWLRSKMRLVRTDPDGGNGSTS